MHAKAKIFCLVCLLLFGLILLLSGFSMFAIKFIIKTKISEISVLKNGSLGFKNWIDPPVSLYIDFTLFTINNPEGILKGEKPSVKEIGPYVYRQIRTKNDVIINSDGTISYKEIISYHFCPELSKGKENDTVIALNIPLINMASVVENLNHYLKEFLAEFIKHVMHESVFVKYTVKHYVWGYEDPFLKRANDFFKKWHLDFKFKNVYGLFTGSKANMSSDGVFTVHSGSKNIKDRAKIVSWNNLTSLTYWSTKTANMINGTDGSIQQPFMQDVKTIYMFSPYMCRSMKATYKEQRSKYGINLMRFMLSKNLLANDSCGLGFCVPDNSSCFASGVLSMQSCSGGPMLISFPHFTDADPVFVDAVAGMHPSPRYETHFDMEPYTGGAFDFTLQLQLNIVLKRLAVLPSTSKVKTTVFPIMWFKEHADISPELASQFKQSLYLPLTLVDAFTYVCLLIGAPFVIILIILIRKNSQAKKRCEDSCDKETLLPATT